MNLAVSSLIALVAALADPRPCASDLWHFPHPSICAVEIQHCCARLTYLEAARPLFPGQDFTFAQEIARVERCRMAWQHLRTAHGGSPRYWLAELRELIGPEDYYAGRMPNAWGQ